METWKHLYGLLCCNLYMLSRYLKINDCNFVFRYMIIIFIPYSLFVILVIILQ